MFLRQEAVVKIGCKINYMRPIKGGLGKSQGVLLIFGKWFDEW